MPRQARLITTDIVQLVNEAEGRIRHLIRTTPLERSRYFSDLTGANVFFKFESLQVTGSFKARGAFNKLSSLSAEERRRGAVAASTGNHGAAVAHGLSTFAMQGVIFMPENAAPVKVQAVRGLGAEVVLRDTDSGRTEVFARQYAEENNMTFVSPYNDPMILGGQGTIGKELAEQLGGLDQVHELFISVGGGGLVCGVGGYLKGLDSGVRVTACSAAVDCAMHASVLAGKVVDFPASAETLADGCAGGVEEDAITLPLVQQIVDEWCLVDEAKIALSMRQFIENEHQLLEGSAGLAISALIDTAVRDPGRIAKKNVVIIVCGSRIGLGKLRAVLGESS